MVGGYLNPGYFIMNVKTFKVFVVAGTFFFLVTGLGIVWYGSMSIAKLAGMTEMRARYDGGQRALKDGRQKVAKAGFQEAAAVFQKAYDRPGYYIGMGEDFLTAGNCYWQLGRFRAAQDYYRLALEHDPNNIILLTSLGNVAFRLAEYHEAATFLGRSRELYPFNRKVNKTLGLLRGETGNRDKDGRKH